MPIASSWPLAKGGIRRLTPPSRLLELASHPLSRELYPTALGYYPHAAGHRMQRSSLEHTDLLILYVAAGAGRWLVGPEWRNLSAGDLLLLPAGMAHAYQAKENEPWSLYWAHVAGRGAQDIIDIFSLPCDGAARTLRPDPSLTGEFDRMLLFREGGQDLIEWLAVASALRTWLLRAALAWRRERALEEVRFPLAEVISRMREHPGSTFSVADLAQELGISTFHLIRRYRQLTGQSPLQHFLQMRIERACRLLDETELPVSRIAEELGYTDPHYFSRVFRKLTGLSPSAYRESKRG